VRDALTQRQEQATETAATYRAELAEERAKLKVRQL
jgi:hypothetical protein